VSEHAAPSQRAAGSESRFAQVGGLRLHYLEWGRPEAPPIVLLHGGGQSAHTWQRVAGRLQRRYRLIAPVARGHSDHPESRLGPEDLWAAAARVPCSALVVHGSESDILSRDAGQRLAGVLPHGRYVSVAGSGHSVQGDNPHSLSEAIEQFLAEIGY